MGISPFPALLFCAELCKGRNRRCCLQIRCRCSLRRAMPFPIQQLPSAAAASAQPECRASQTPSIPPHRAPGSQSRAKITLPGAASLVLPCVSAGSVSPGGKQRVAQRAPSLLPWLWKGICFQQRCLGLNLGLSAHGRALLCCRVGKRHF